MTNTADPVEVVGTLYELFSRGQVEDTYDLMDSEVLLIEPGDPDLLPWAGRFEGHQGLRRFYEGLSSGLAEIAIDPATLSIQSINDHEVLVTGVERGVARGTSKTYETHSAWVWTVLNGRITHLRAYHDTAAMVEAMSA